MKPSDIFPGRPLKRATQVTLAGRTSAHIDAEDLNGLPTISDESVMEIAKTSWPADEERTTAEIYAAAEAIREKRPRDPVGYITGELVEIPMLSLDAPNRRRWSKGLSA
jgi:hypothetical protein